MRDSSRERPSEENKECSPSNSKVVSSNSSDLCCFLLNVLQVLSSNMQQCLRIAFIWFDPKFSENRIYAEFSRRLQRRLIKSWFVEHEMWVCFSVMAAGLGRVFRHSNATQRCGPLAEFEKPGYPPQGVCEEACDCFGVLADGLPFARTHLLPSPWCGPCTPIYTQYNRRNDIAKKRILLRIWDVIPCYYSDDLSYPSEHSGKYCESWFFARNQNWTSSSPVMRSWAFSMWNDSTCWVYGRDPRKLGYVIFSRMSTWIA